LALCCLLGTRSICAIELCSPSTYSGDLDGLKLQLKSQLLATFFEQPFLVHSSGVRLWQADVVAAVVSNYSSTLAVSGLAEVMVEVFKAYANHSVLKPQLTGDVAQLDQLLLGREKGFWLMHWFGVWVGEEVMKMPRTIFEYEATLIKCIPRLEAWSVVHGLSGHFLARTSTWSALQVRGTVARLGTKLCNVKGISFYSDCFHGVGHGIMHALIIDKFQVNYSAHLQFFQVALDATHFDAAMRLCGELKLLEAAGCADGISHSYFNYMPIGDWPQDWVAFCAPRVWPALCFRSIVQYAPLSVHNISKDGRPTQAEWLEMVQVKPRELASLPRRLAERCMELPEQLQPSCVYGIMSSSYGYQVVASTSAYTIQPDEVAKFCSQSLFWNNRTRLMDACLIAAYNVVRKKRSPKARVIPHCVELQLDAHGSRCQLDPSEPVIWGAKLYPSFACERERCPYDGVLAATPKTAREEEHHVDGH